MESSKVPALTWAIGTLSLIARIGSCSAAAIIDTLGILRNTAYLLLNELRRQRLLSLDHQENFCLRIRLVEPSGRALSKVDPRELTQPRLTQLMDTTGLLCHLGTIDNGDAYYILRVGSSATTSVRSHEGRSLLLYRSEIGKCLLVWQPAVIQKGIIEELIWEQMAPTTITHPQRLYEELARVRRQGWSYDNGEDYADVRCVAAPVFNVNDGPIAAISVAGTRLQINEEYRDYPAGRAIAYARGISRLLGWKSPFDLQTS